jgi:predicted MFS family arabinose efflux permease
LNIVIVAALVLMGTLQALWAIPFLLLIYFVRGIQNPLAMDYINRIATSDKRATILSIKSLIFRLEFVALSPIIGVLTDKISLRFALLMAASVYAIAFAILFPILRKNSPVKKKSPESEFGA